MPHCESPGNTLLLVQCLWPHVSVELADGTKWVLRGLEMVWCSLEELSVSVGVEDSELESSVLASILDGWSGRGNWVVSDLGFSFLDSGSCLEWFWMQF